MWLGYVLSVMLITNNDVLIAYDLGHYNVREECVMAKDEAREALYKEGSIRDFHLTCRENKQLYNNHYQYVKQ